MNTYKLEHGADFGDLVATCAELLAQPGTVLLLPTETVYGLICRWSDSAAKKRIFKLKGRDENKPFQMMISSTQQLEDLGVVVPPVARKVTDAFCPGPITILVPHDGAKVGYRIPDHAFFLEILRVIGEPLAATSANLTGDALALTVDDATSSLIGQPDLVVNAGALENNVMASTVVDILDNSFSIVRSGPISEDDIQQVLVR